MDKEKNIEDGSIPLHILNLLNEYSVGGFVLFHFNSQDGIPEQVMTFDSPAHSLALQKHIADWSIALQELNIDQERKHLEADCAPAPDEESE